jgi:hypothetical protein
MNINQIITLGIGTPSDITHFLLVGLSVNPPIHRLASDCWTDIVPAELVAAVPADTWAVRAPAADWIVRVPECDR